MILVRQSLGDSSETCEARMMCIQVSDDEISKVSSGIQSTTTEVQSSRVESITRYQNR